MTVCHLDLRGIEDKAELRERLFGTHGLPECGARNLDALYDALCSDALRRHFLVLADSEAAHCVERVLELLLDAADYSPCVSVNIQRM